jgi:hypothetical protein
MHTQEQAQERLRQLIDEQQRHLREAVPPDRAAALISLVRVRNRLPRPSEFESLPDMVTGHRLAHPGGNKALQLCLEAQGEQARSTAGSPGDDLDVWAEQFLQACGWLAEADLVLTHCETGFMRLIDVGHGTFHAWIATKRPPPGWRERADIDWWASWLARRYEPQRLALRPQEQDGPEPAALYRQLGSLHLKALAYQLGYPHDAVIGDCTVQAYCDVLVELIAKAFQERDRDQPITPQSEHELVAGIASALAVDPVVIGHAIAAFTLDRENAAYHAGVPGVAAAPLVRIDQDRLVWSIHGLTSEPLLFLTRELRRRNTQEYHNTAWLREDVFRQDLYTLFQDKRFVTSSGRIELRRLGGDIRTDIDAVVFDRKTGTLGVFELKSQDPFARSTAALLRQRDNLLYANRQVSGVLDWLKRHGADEILNRVDSRTAKFFRVQKVYPFVLGRYLAHFGDGPAPDRRAAWGAWPQVLRLLDEQPFRTSEANPLASLFTRLTKEAPLTSLPPFDSPREIAIGSARLIVFPSYAAFKAQVTN